jgi:hypothetical protein
MTGSNSSELPPYQDEAIASVFGAWQGGYRASQEAGR